MVSSDAERDWTDCRMRLGTSGPVDLVAIARRNCGQRSGNPGAAS